MDEPGTERKVKLEVGAGFGLVGGEGAGAAGAGRGGAEAAVNIRPSVWTRSGLGVALDESMEERRERSCWFCWELARAMKNACNAACGVLTGGADVAGAAGGGTGGGVSAAEESLRLRGRTDDGCTLGLSDAFRVASGADEPALPFSSFGHRSGSVVKRAPVFRFADFFSVAAMGAAQVLARGSGIRLPCSRG